MTVHWYRLILWFGNIPISHQAGHWRKIGWNDLGFAVFVSHSANTTGGPGRRAAATRRRTAPLHTAGSWQDQRCIHIIRARTHAHTSTSSNRQNTRVHSTHTHTHAHAHINFTLASSLPPRPEAIIWRATLLLLLLLLLALCVDFFLTGRRLTDPCKISPFVCATVAFSKHTITHTHTHTLTHSSKLAKNCTFR